MLSIIVAHSKNRVIGNKGKIPWNLPDDLKHFANITKGHTVVMGRKTYESIIKRLGKTLPGRNSVVISSQSGFLAPGCEVVQSVDDVIWKYSQIKEEVFVIGGGEIYNQLLSAVDKLYITEVDVVCDGDAVFSGYFKNDWEQSAKKHHEADGKHQYSFDFIELIKKNKRS